MLLVPTVRPSANPFALSVFVAPGRSCVLGRLNCPPTQEVSSVAHLQPCSDFFLGLGRWHEPNRNLHSHKINEHSRGWEGGFQRNQCLCYTPQRGLTKICCVLRRTLAPGPDVTKANHSAAFEGSGLPISQEPSLQLNYFLIFPSNLLLPSVRLFLDP